MTNKLIGAELPFSKMVVLILAVLAVLFMLNSVFKIAGNVGVIITDRELYSECTKWASEDFNRESFDEKDIHDKTEYPTLYETYNGSYADARRFCEQKT